MKIKILNLILILTSLIGYLEWGQNNSMFLLEAEVEIFKKLFSEPASVIHPFTLLPLIGQLLLFITLLQKKPGTVLTYIGIGGLGLLLIFICMIGVLSLNAKQILSSLPFLITAIATIRAFRKLRKEKQLTSILDEQ